MAAAPAPDTSRSALQDLSGLIDKKASSGTNVSPEHPVAHLFSADPSQFVQSDVDEQLILELHTKVPVHLKEIMLTCDEADMRPTVMRLYCDLPSLDFDDVEDMKPSQQIELEEDSFGKRLKLDGFVGSFKRVRKLFIYLESDGDEGLTALSGLHIFGMALADFDVKALKEADKPEAGDGQ